MSKSIRRRAQMIAVTLLLLSPTAALAGDRVELPVRLVTLSDGARRFGVPVTIDGHQVEAGLDTGSTGLRVMARALPGQDGGGGPVRYGYGAGTRLDGVSRTVTVGFGTLSGAVKVQRVDRLSCTTDHPECPVKRDGDPATFGIQGDGLPGEGFAAILGVNLREASDPNPFKTLGVRRWIVELPRPGDSGPGRIILNPTDDDLAGYARYRLLADDNSLAACLTGSKPLGQVCAPATLDSGAPGLFILDPAPRTEPKISIPLTLTIGDRQAQTSAQFASNERDRASKLTVERKPDARQLSIHLGIAPYWIWSVFYDADAHVIGLKPR